MGCIFIFFWIWCFEEVVLFLFVVVIVVIDGGFGWVISREDLDVEGGCEKEKSCERVGERVEKGGICEEELKGSGMCREG